MDWGSDRGPLAVALGGLNLIIMDPLLKVETFVPYEFDLSGSGLWQSRWICVVIILFDKV